MSADRLRAAAKVLRERTMLAALGPWTAEIHEDGRAWIGQHRNEHMLAAHGHPRTAEYIVTMHPGVGLALADWLDDAAREAEEVGENHHAARVADLILGGAS